MTEREHLESAVETAAANSRRLIASGAAWSAIRDAQDAWSDAVGDLARYLLETGEPGWIGHAANDFDSDERILEAV
jgi:hypothetical protein